MMGSTYENWRSAYDAAASGDPRLTARRMILEAEGRVPAAHQLFIDRLVVAFDAQLAVGDAPPQAALAALDAVLKAAAEDPRFCYLLSVSAGTYEQATTHVTALYLARFGTFGDIDADPSAPLRIPVSFNEAFATTKPKIWFTPDDCPRDPDETAKVLGLPHFAAQIAYRIDVALPGVPQFVPTCFDADLFEAWQAPPANHGGPCGRTRHIETGHQIHNEFLVRTVDVHSQGIALDRLPGSGPVVRVGRLHPDYLVNR